MGSPLDLIKCPTKAFAPGGVDHLHKTDAAQKMKPKGIVAVAVLTLRPVPNAVGERRFESIEVASNDIDVLVNPGEAESNQGSMQADLEGSTASKIVAAQLIRSLAHGVDSAASLNASLRFHGSANVKRAGAEVSTADR